MWLNSHIELQWTQSSAAGGRAFVACEFGLATCWTFSPTASPQSKFFKNFQIWNLRIFGPPYSLRVVALTILWWRLDHLDRCPNFTSSSALDNSQLWS
jgi:hypothetical protein